MTEDLKKLQQAQHRTERELALVKLKQRKADTRRKIELGGLVIKAGMDQYSKEIILGGLVELNSRLLADEQFVEKLRQTGLKKL